MIPAILFLVGTLAGSSLVIGALLAIVVVIWAEDVASAVWLIGNGYYLLAGMMPVVLWLGLFASHDEAEYRAGYTSALRAVLTTLQGAIVGSVLGAGPIFLTVAVNLPVIVGDFYLDDFGPAVRDAIVWSRLSLAVAAATISAIPLGLWAYYMGDGRG